MLALLAAPGAAAKDDLDLVSRNSAGAPADESSRAPAISADGRYVAFSSRARNLGRDSSATTDIFRHDFQTGRTILVSRPTGRFRVPANGDSISPSISADGNRIAFVSKATNLSVDDRDSMRHVYVRDVRQGTTTLVSRASGGGPVARGSASGVISADGNHVAFQSSANNLSTQDADGNSDIFVHDLRDRSTRLVSIPDATIVGPSNGSSLAAAISADGSIVAFLSTADNLSTQGADGVKAIYVRATRGPARTILASRAVDGSPSRADSGAPSLSDDGTRVAFGTRGRLDPGDVNDALDIYLRDLTAGETALVSRAPLAEGGAVGNATSVSPAISGDGRYVAFISPATNLAAIPGRPRAHMLVRDLEGDAATLVSRARGPLGAPAAGSTQSPALSRTGRFAAFASGAPNLIPGTAPGLDVFRRDVLGDGADDGGAEPAEPPPGGTPAPQGTPLRCDGRAVTIVGTNAAETILGTPGPDVILALGGNDVVRGAGGNDRICLGPGADRGFGGSGRDRIFGQRGNDRIAGGSARDRIDGGPGNDRISGQGGNDALIGRGGRDRLDGGRGNDTLIGNGGMDTLLGRGGRDLARAGGGADLVRLGNGNDRAFGQAGRDRLFGQRGRDRLIGGAGFDRADGGAGRDRCSAERRVSC